MSSTKKLGLLAFAALFLLLTGPATAGGKVDWSAYIDPNPSRPVTVAPAVAKHDAPARSKKKAKRANKKSAKSKATKAKARAKKKKARRR